MSLKKLLLMCLMIASAVAAVYLEPTHKIASDRKDFVLEKIIPRSFGDWKVVDNGFKAIVNPQQESLVHKLYSQTLSRNYVNSKGETIMLVIAYGEDQSDNNQLHYPEVCYPAQGFQISSNRTDILKTPIGSIRLKRLIAEQSQRIEPITYWTTIGNKVVMGSKETKIEKLKYGFNGLIPDGYLFRVSSIGSPEQGFQLQNEFITRLIELPDVRHNLLEEF